MFCACFHTVCYASAPPAAHSRLRPIKISENEMADLSDPNASVLMETTEKMVEIWTRLSPEKQAALLERFGTKETALAALVTTQLLNPTKG